MTVLVMVVSAVVVFVYLLIAAVVYGVMSTPVEDQLAQFEDWLADEARGPVYRRLVIEALKWPKIVKKALEDR